VALAEPPLSLLLEDQHHFRTYFLKTHDDFAVANQIERVLQLS
jgi:hypothetical protein